MPSWKKLIISGSDAVLNTVTASFFTGSFRGDGSGLTGVGGSTPTGSLLTTASVNLNTITFTKGDGSTFPITIDTGSGGGGSGAGFPFAGDAVITGSLLVSGSGVNINGGLVITGSFDNGIGIISSVQFVSGTSVTAEGNDIRIYTPVLPTDTAASVKLGARRSIDDGGEPLNLIQVDETGIYLATEFDGDREGSSWRILSDTSRTLVAGGPLNMSGLNITNGNLIGTASQATTASYVATVFQSVSSSYALTASYLLNIPIDTGSFVLTSSFNAFTSSINNYTQSLNNSTGSFVVTSSFNALTSSFNAFTSSINNYTQSLNNKTGSFITTGSITTIQAITGSVIVSGSGITTTGSVNISTQLNVAGPAVANMSASIWGRMQITSGALEVLGGTRANALNISTAINAGLALNITNTNSGSSAASQIALFNSTGSFAQLYMPSPTNASAGAAGASRFMIRTNGTRGMLIQSESGSIDIGVDGDRTILSVTTGSLTATEVSGSTMVVSNTAVRISGSAVVTGSLLVSGSSTFTNIGPARFTGSVGILGSLTLNGSSIQSSKWVETQLYDQGFPLDIWELTTARNYQQVTIPNNLAAGQSSSVSVGYFNITAGAFTTASADASIIAGIETTINPTNITTVDYAQEDYIGFYCTTNQDLSSFVGTSSVTYLFDDSQCITNTGYITAFNTSVNTLIVSNDVAETGNVNSPNLQGAILQKYIEDTSLLSVVQSQPNSVSIVGDYTGIFSSGDFITLIVETDTGLSTYYEREISSVESTNQDTWTQLNFGDEIIDTISNIVSSDDLSNVTATPIESAGDSFLIRTVGSYPLGTTQRAYFNITDTSLAVDVEKSAIGANDTAGYTYYLVSKYNPYDPSLLNNMQALLALAEGVLITGKGTIASASYQTVVGKYNTKNNTSSVFIVGTGTSASSRADGLKVDSSRTTFGGGITLKSEVSANSTTVYMSPSASVFFVNQNTQTVILPTSSLVPQGSIYYIKSNPQNGPDKFAISASGGDNIDSESSRYSITGSDENIKPCIQIAMAPTGYWGLLSVWNGVTS